MLGCHDAMIVRTRAQDDPHGAIYDLISRAMAPRGRDDRRGMAEGWVEPDIEERVNPALPYAATAWPDDARSARSPRPFAGIGHSRRSSRRFDDLRGETGSRSIQPWRTALVRNRRIWEIMMSDMGTFRTTIAIENPLHRGPRHVFADALVDTGAELTWVPAAVLVDLGIARQKRVGFRTADGRAVYRDVGYAIVHAGGVETNDEVVFGEAGDTTLLGARSLEGLNLRVDAREKRLVEAGPMPAMAT